MNELITQKLKEYGVSSANEEMGAMKEIVQEIILFGLARTDFFEHAFFCGGTVLRIVHGLNRFSEDLYFTTLEPNQSFSFDLYMEDVLKVLRDLGLEMKVSKAKDDSFVKARALKEDSDKWKVSFPSDRQLKKVMVKLEIDTNPPAGSETVMYALDFPLLHRIKCGSLETLFAGKIHALLCRSYVKGRDWYDFLWYVQRKEKINLEFLKNALLQMGPYKGNDLDVTVDWIRDELKKKIKEQQWKMVAKDVSRFLRPLELSTLDFWDEDLFLNRVERLGLE
jgi:predicted nucleotidyltransferase component of viral defense system